MEKFVTDRWAVDTSKLLTIVRLANGGFLVVFSEQGILYENLFFNQYLDARNYAKDIMAGYSNIVYNGSK